VAHASKALDGVRREQQKTDPALKGMRWSLLKDADKLNLAIFAHPPKTEDLHQTLSRRGFQRRISAGNALD
jgi:hypothetical protein